MNRVLLALVIFWLAGCATEDPAITSQTTELLLIQPPANFKRIYQLNSANSRMSDFIPDEESVAEWSTRLTLESFSDLVDADPIGMLQGEVEQDQDRCNFVQNFNLFSGLENNYATSVRLYMCGENAFAKRGEIKLIKAIQGNDFFYLIKLLKRLDPFTKNQPDIAQEEIAAWSAYLRQVSLCDTAREEHPCP